MNTLTKKQYAAIVAQVQESCAYNGITNAADIQLCIDNTVSNHVDFYNKRNDKLTQTASAFAKALIVVAAFLVYGALMISDALYATGGLGILVSCIVGFSFFVMLGVHMFTGITKFAGFNVFAKGV
jgi:hypothetical protein